MLRHTRRPASIFLCVFAIMLMVAAIGQAVQKTPQTSKAHARITASQANTIALKKYPGKLVAKTTLENEEGVWQYAVMVRSGKKLREVMVNAKTGHIDNVEVTTPAKEGVEANAEAKAKAAGKGKTTPKAK